MPDPHDRLSGLPRTTAQPSSQHTVHSARRALREGVRGVADVGGQRVELRTVNSGSVGEVLGLVPAGVTFRPLPGCTDTPGDLWLAWSRGAENGEVWLAGWWRQVDLTEPPTGLVGSRWGGPSGVLALEIAEGFIRMYRPDARAVVVPLDDESLQALTGPEQDVCA